MVVLLERFSEKVFHALTHYLVCSWPEVVLVHDVMHIAAHWSAFEGTDILYIDTVHLYSRDNFRPRWLGLQPHHKSLYIQ